MAFSIYTNIGKAVEARGGVLEEPPLNEESFRRALATTEYVVVRGTRRGHPYLPPSSMVFIFFAEGSELIARNEKFQKTWNKILPQTGPVVDNVVLVVHANLSHYIRATLTKIRAENPKQYIETCMYYKFLMNFPESSVYCKHEIVDPGEVKKLCEQQRFDPNFKAIRADDTGAIWCGARPGDIVKITHMSHNSGYAIDYRVCIEPY